ncbi:YraN family protein [Coraliomargarita parva]|uniref:YraN family protein n=1 Tax=Coraliomargarita parva TaxID=3014050 RepID=UPI0022B3ECCB|nr:YraN family protein [Coraliomargarita parva]
MREWLSRGNSRPLPPDSSRAARGRYGEDRAADYCRRQLGYRIIARNWRYKRDELDLICRDGEVLVFVEVRLRKASAKVSGYHSVDRKKKAVLKRACMNYLRRLPSPPKHFRFDVIDAALSDDGRAEVRHFANVPLFPKHYTAQR